MGQSPGGLSLRRFLWPRKESVSSCGAETPLFDWLLQVKYGMGEQNVADFLE
jgi:hypothetical protein